MNLEQFCAWLDQLGSDITQWPTDAQDGAQELLAASPEARAHHFAQQQMDEPHSFLVITCREWRPS
jgi:hypothetical protein